MRLCGRIARRTRSAPRTRTTSTTWMAASRSRPRKSRVATPGSSGPAATAASKSDPNRYYEDPKYYHSGDLVKPYRVGMSCAFCHVGPNPLKPPADPENPGWENLSSNVGAQYFWIDRIFDWDADASNFVF